MWPVITNNPYAHNDFADQNLQYQRFQLSLYLQAVQYSNVSRMLSSHVVDAVLDSASPWLPEIYMQEMKHFLECAIAPPTINDLKTFYDGRKFALSAGDYQTVKKTYTRDEVYSEFFTKLLCNFAGYLSKIQFDTSVQDQTLITLLLLLAHPNGLEAMPSYCVPGTFLYCSRLTPAESDFQNDSASKAKLFAKKISDNEYQFNQILPCNAYHPELGSSAKVLLSSSFLMIFQWTVSKDEAGNWSKVNLDIKQKGFDLLTLAEQGHIKKAVTEHISIIPFEELTPVNYEEVRERLNACSDKFMREKKYRLWANMEPQLIASQPTTLVGTPPMQVKEYPKTAPPSPRKQARKTAPVNSTTLRGFAPPTASSGTGLVGTGVNMLFQLPDSATQPEMGWLSTQAQY